jgi:hypothetical protein
MTEKIHCWGLNLKVLDPTGFLTFCPAGPVARPQEEQEEESGRGLSHANTPPTPKGVLPHFRSGQLETNTHHSLHHAANERSQEGIFTFSYEVDLLYYSHSLSLRLFSLHGRMNHCFFSGAKVLVDC